MTRVVILGLILALHALPARAAGDWDGVWDAVGQIAYGNGSKLLIGLVAGYFILEGLFHRRPVHILFAVAGCLFYFGIGAMLGRIGIV
jgi:hypothetical protein